MKAGAASADITPEHPVPLAGFASRGGMPVGRIAAPLRVRVLVLESGVDGQRVAIASAELLNWPRELVDEHRAMVAESVGCGPEDVLLTATHSHSGPQPNTTVTPSMGPADAAYLAVFASALRDAASRAARDLVAVSARRGEVAHRLGAYRRVLVEGRVSGGFDRGGPRDDLLTTIHLVDGSGGTVAGLVHYTCHAVISAEDAVSGDFPGYACSALERDHGGTFLYLQGCCGDIDPDGLTARGDAQARAAGEELAASAGRSMELAARVGADAFEVHRIDLPLTLIRDLDVVDDEKGGALRAEWAATLATHPERLRDTETLTVQLVGLTEDCGLLSLNGEPSVGYGELVRRLSGGKLLPVGYANGMIGYLPRAFQVGEGGYEAVQSAFYYGTAGRFGADIESAIESAIGVLALHA